MNFIIESVGVKPVYI